MKYLTNQYVLALGLEPAMHWLAGQSTASWVPENAIKPVTGGPPFVQGVEFDGSLYLREADGLAWRRT